MYRKEMIAIVLGLFLFIVSGCSDSSENEETTVHNNNTTVENPSYENTTRDGDEESVDSYSIMMSYVEQIQSDFTEEQVVVIMGETDFRDGSGIVYNHYYFGDYEVNIIYASYGLLLDIINNTTGERKRVY